jgi:hypothetical protein
MTLYPSLYPSPQNREQSNYGLYRLYHTNAGVRACARTHVRRTGYTLVQGYRPTLYHGVPQSDGPFAWSRQGLRPWYRRPTLVQAR